MFSRRVLTLYRISTKLQSSLCRAWHLLADSISRFIVTYIHITHEIIQLMCINFIKLILFIFKSPFV